MCGINGIVCNAGMTVDRAQLVEMRDTMVHRGPDGCGDIISACGRVGLGHRRLSIIDLSEAAGQPMSNDDQSVWVTFNGEIYNYLELMPMLRAAGHRFQSRSDTEVIIHAYEEWGVACLDRFIGMFAFAIWDKKKNHVMLARDHLGIKPLYFCFGAHGFLFASEQKAILAAAPECRKPNYGAIYDFISATQYRVNESSFFSSIEQIKPGHYCVFELDTWRAPVQRSYWNISSEHLHRTYDYNDPVETFKSLFRDSIKLQLRSDVPVGAYLSGGIDSSGIVAEVSEKVDHRLRTFSAVYSEPSCAEGHFAEMMTSMYPVIARTVQPTLEKLKDHLERFLWAQEMPTMGPGPFTEYCVSEIASRDVTVVLSGQGPDEMFGGYYHCFVPYLKTRLSHLIRRFDCSAMMSLCRDARAIGSLTGKPLFQYAFVLSFSNPQILIRELKRKQQHRLLHPDFIREYRHEADSYEPPLPGGTYLDNYLLHELTVEGLPALLHYADRNSMAWSIEARVPYLDHRLVEFSVGLPYDWKINGSTTKYILRRAMEDRLPAEIAWRRDKKGFATPISGWLRQGEAWVRDILSTEAIRRRGIYSPGNVQRLIADHMACRRDFSWEIWRLLNLEIWFGQLTAVP